jgi:hypothetical protein
VVVSDDVLPREDTGKLMKRKIRARYWPAAATRAAQPWWSQVREDRRLESRRFLASVPFQQRLWDEETDHGVEIRESTGRITGG